MSNRRRKEPAASNNYSDGPLPNLVQMLPCLGGGDGEGPTMKDLERRIEKLEERHEETQKTLHSIECSVKVTEAKIETLATRKDIESITNALSAITTSLNGMDDKIDSKISSSSLSSLRWVVGLSVPATGIIVTAICKLIG